MSTFHTEFTNLSVETNAMFDSIMKKAETKLLKLENDEIDEKLQLAVWECFGSSIQKQLKLGRAVVVPKFGIFTFTTPEVDLKGTTNVLERNREPRRPIFLIAKDFIRGLDIKQGIATESSVLPYPINNQEGVIPHSSLSFIEIAIEAKTSKETAKICIGRVLREVIWKIKNKKPVKIDIPYLGTLIVQNNVAAVKFLDPIIEDLKEATTRGIRNIKLNPILGHKRNVSLIDKPKDDPIFLDLKAQEYLRTSLNMDVKLLTQSPDPKNSYQKMFANTMSFRAAPFKMSHDLSRAESQTVLRKADNGLYLKRILYWMRNRKLGPEDAFYDVIGSVQGPDVNSSTTVSNEEFEEVLQKMDIRIGKATSLQLFKFFDKNGDGFIDLQEWISTLTSDMSPAQFLSETMLKYNLTVNELFEKMGFGKSTYLLDRKMLADGFSKLDSSLSEDVLSRYAESILDGNVFVELDDLSEIIDSQYVDKKIDTNWLAVVKSKLKFKLEIFQKYDAFVSQLEKYSESDLIPSNTFKSILTKINIGIPTSEINRLAKYYENLEGKINYKKFVEKLAQSASQAHSLTLHSIADKLHKFIETSGMDVNSFLRSLDAKAPPPNDDDSDADSLLNSGTHKASLSLFSAFLQKRLLVDFTLAEIGFYVECIDIDRDGQIGKDDLEIFIKRGSLFAKTQKTSIYSTLNKFDEKVELFPKKPLSEEVLQMVLAELRIVMRNRRLTPHDLFQKMDENKDGFVTIDELCQRLDEIISLPQEVKEGLFSTIDRLKIGIIDYNSFLRVMNKSAILKEKVVTEDSFDWSLEALQQMKNYFLLRKITEEDAFRMVDYDFDGTISRKDLAEFLNRVLKYQKHDLLQSRIERTFKLLDHYKRGYIQLEDFKRLFQAEQTFSPEKINIKNASTRSSSTGQLLMKSQITMESIHTSRHFDWKINARQQIGLKLSRDYEDMKSSFDGISGHKGRITYETFKKWVEDNNVLQGFNLTEHLLLRLYADLDPHKKGYLVLTDWENAFSQFSWNHQILAEVQDVLYTNFHDTNAAYQFFLKKGGRSEYDSKPTEIGYKEFKNAIESLIPKRFSQSDLKILWEKISFNSEYLNFDHFKSFLNPSKFHLKIDQSFLPTLSSPKRQGEGSSIYSSSLRHSVTTKALMNGEDFIRGVYAQDVFERLKMHIRAGKNSIVDLFKEIDRDQSARVTSLEFRNVIKKLNLGFTSIQINQLLDFADTLPDGTIDYNSFINRILLKESEARIFNRVQDRLKALKHNIKGFLITPKDAFYRFNKNDNGRLTYEEFNDFISYIHKMTGEDMPPLSIIRDLFDFIDVKKDGIIDLNEWIETFNHVTGIEAKEDTKVLPKKNIVNLSKDYISYNNPDWENTKNYDEVMKAIGRNRKLIFGKFMNLEQRKVKINFDAAKEILKEVVSNCKLKVEDKNWPTLISFADKDGKVDYRLLLDVYRQRVQKIMDAPRAKIVFL